MKRGLNEILGDLIAFSTFTAEFDRNEREERAPLQLILIDMMIRINAKLISLQKLFQSEAKAFEDTHDVIGLILRSLLSDCLTVYYVVCELDNNAGYFDSGNNREYHYELFKRINMDQICSQESTLKSMLKNEHRKKIDRQLVQEAFDNLRLNYSVYFTQKPKLLTMREKFKLIAQNDRFMNDALGLEVLWRQYSMYEHYGPLTIIARSKPLETKWVDLLLSLTFTTQSIAYMIIMVSPDVGKDCFEKIKDELVDLKDEIKF